jgi:nitrogen fixation NifU-like protein
MISDHSDQYQEVILDHNRPPRNFHPHADASHTAQGYNPLCGDRLTLYLKLAGGTIEDVSFEGAGCAISKASASMMTDALKGRTVEEAHALFERFHRMVTTPPDQAVEDMGKLSSLAGVREVPVRVKCASLAWHTLKAAMAQQPKVSTE